MLNVRERPDQEESRRIINVDVPRHRSDLYDRKFITAFLNTIDNPTNQGLLTTHLFYDLPSSGPLASSSLPYDPINILSGGKAWERHIDDSIHNNTYSLLDNDEDVIKYAIQHSLVQTLPRTIKFVSYGGGNAFDRKEFRIVNAVVEDSNRDVSDFCAVDILERFAIGGAVAANRLFGIRSQGVVGDILCNGKLAIDETTGSPVVMIFGGSFENTPSTSNAPDPRESTAIAWAKMNIQHGLGSTVIKTFDTDQDPARQEEAYSPSKNFEAFILSAFARAIQLGIIEDASYDVLENWRLKREFDLQLSSVKLIAECKKTHTLKINGTNRKFLGGETPDRRTITLSHKWGDLTHIDIAKRAGYEIKHIYSNDENPVHLLVAEATKRPDRDLLDMINQQSQPPLPH
ncbi:MAG TPA: L-histidine N(alpha)-methyltransferase [Alphaproteobacteria bacterium]|nr:L-histidine N(alpha)-methyltransferase [Alphaproteobacteria bacterium]